MNANELADLIGLLESDTQMSSEIRKMLRKSAATMLRQQQAEIEALNDLTIVMQIELDYLRDKAQEK